MRAALRTLLVGALLGAGVPALAQTCPPRDSWPGEEWARRPVDPVAKAAALQALEDYAFTLEGKDAERLGYRTDGLVIVKGGAIVYERYARGYDETKRHLSWSVAKSYSSALAGVAVRLGAASLDDSICAHLPEYEASGKCGITLRHAITFATGLAWQEEYEDQGYQVSSVIAMLYGVGRGDQLAHILGHKLVATPGERWNYSTGDSELVAAVVKRALAKQHGRDAFWTTLFDRIGSPSVVVEEDAKGTPLGGSMVYATPRDFARFGYLFLNDGCWHGERLLPEGWVAASTTPSAAYVGFAPEGEKEPNGYSWWLNRPVPSRGQGRPWPDVPEDTYVAQGHWGQRIAVVPSEDVVIVRTGDDRQGSIPVNELVKRALEVAR